MNAEKRILSDTLSTSNYLTLIAGTKAKQVLKNSESSVQARKEGNLLFCKNDHSPQIHEEIFRLYCKSIALAPNESEELALAYGNRSALLYHLQKYNESILDIDRALKITQSNSLKEKLFFRRSQCLSFLHEIKSRENEFKNNQNKILEKEIKKLCVDVSNLSAPKCLSESFEDNTSLLKDLNKKEREYSLNSVVVRYNEKHGRHLVAANDISPGEIIFVEKPYVSCLNIKKHYIYCCHCLSVAWTGIPCDNCSWFIFCSEKCKYDACKEYHDIECSCFPYIVHFINFLQEETKQNIVFDALSLRTLIKGVRELGSLEKLKELVQNIDKCKDKCNRGFSENGFFESNKFRSLYSLSSDIPSKELKSYAMFAAVVLICLSKYTSFFGKKNEYLDVEELIENPDTIFTGSLIFKLSKINHINSYGIINVNETCKNALNQEECRKTWCCIKGACISPTASLINNSCNPNARRCFTEDTKYVLYALQPIKKNSQIFDSYYCAFYESHNLVRKGFLEENFYFQCDCEACLNNWPPWTLFGESFEGLLSRKTYLSEEEKKVAKEFSNLMSSIKEKNNDFDLSLLHALSKAVEKSTNLFGYKPQFNQRCTHN